MTSPKRILVKVGGAILDDPGTRATFASSVAAAVGRGDSVVVVHGGGAQVSRLTDALGLVPRRVRGLRVTDDETARAVLQVLGGEVNATLVAALQGTGVDAIGVTGADGGLFAAAIVDPALGHVGAVSTVDGAVIERLVSAGFAPVVATVTPAANETDVFLNVNADMAVAPLAAAWGADAILFLSDVPHVKNGDDRVPSIDPDLAAALEADGVVAGGMIPKVEAALEAAKVLPGATVKIATGSGPDPLAAALDVANGTAVTAQKEEIGRG